MTQAELESRRQRVKRYHAKTSTGCMTCRRRRIKCGEEKPECTRCQRCGIKCDGYQARNRSINMARPEKHVVPGHLTISIVPTSVKLTYGTLEQAELLDFYLRRTAPMISMTTPVKDVWTVIVPQMSWHFTPIKHMICAMSLLDRNVDEDGARRLQITPAQFGKVLNEYNRAISTLGTSNAPDLSSAILFSLVAWSFESMICNYNDAVLHERATRSMLADSRKSDKRLSMQDRLVIERVQRIVDQGNIICGQPHQIQPRLDAPFADLQESWRELYYVIERAATNIDLLIANGWGPLGQSLHEWRAAFEPYRYVGLATLPQKRAIVLVQNMVATYLASMDPQSTLSPSERKRDCILTLDDLESIISTYDDLDELRWIMNPILLNIADVAGESENVISRVQALGQVLAKSASRVREVSPELKFIVSIESTMAAKHAAFRQARALWIKHNTSTQGTSQHITFVWT